MTIDEMTKEIAAQGELIKKLETRALESGKKKEGNEPSPARKMRWDTSELGASKGGSLTPNRKLKVAEYSFEHIALGRLLLKARDGLLPDSLEERFQSEAKKYTMTEAGAATGAELVEDPYWGQIFEDVRNATKVAQLFESVPMTSKTLELCELGDAVFYKPAGEGQAVTATDPATAKRTITAFELKAQVDVSDELDEDAIISMLPALRSRLVTNAAETIDEALLCADASTGKQNINYYAATDGSDLTTSSRFLLGFDGILHYCLAEVTGQKSSVTTLATTSFLTLLSLLGKYGDDPTRLCFILDRGSKLKALGLTEFLGVDKFGSGATILTGQIGSIFGSPVVMSGTLALSNATGQVDQTAGNNTKGRIVLVNRDMWKVGMRRTVRIATERSESKGLTSLVCTFRMGLQCLGDRSSAQYAHTALGYNVTV